MKMPRLIRKITEVNVPEGFTPIEQTTTVSNLEQFVKSVIKYTSRYNVSFSLSYSPDNLIGRYTRYPSHGDFPETYHLRTYGKWWKDSEAFQRYYMPQDVDPLDPHDFITLEFESPVIPRHVCVYETYNPGAVVRIWGRSTGEKWLLLWEGPPQQCPQESRKFNPTIRQYNCFINEIRLEFNQSHLNYLSSLDAVLLGGYQPVSQLQSAILRAGLLGGAHKVKVCKDVEVDEDYPDTDFISQLPHEVIIHIFRNLDLKSLSRCAQVNKTWNEAALDPILYQSLSLKKYWDKVDGSTLDYFRSRSFGLKKLDLSWCGDDDDKFPAKFSTFLQECGKHLTHLSLCHCQFVGNCEIEEISKCKNITELRIRNTIPNIQGLKYLLNLQKLVTLDFQMTNITDDLLIAILKNNPNVKHLNLDFCEKLERLDQAVETVAEFNPHLTSWSSWRTMSLTANGAAHFGRCSNLKELDLGWCFVHTHPGDVLERIARGCRRMKRLIISEWREINDSMLLPIIHHCKELTQLDLLGINTITNEVVERALSLLPNLQLLDVSFCDSVTQDEIARWRERFPNVTIQWSCQYLVTDYLN